MIIFQISFHVVPTLVLCMQTIVHRLHARDIAIRGRWPAQPQAAVNASANAGLPAGNTGRVGLARKNSRSLFPDDDQDDYGTRMEIRLDEFLSETVGEHFT